VNIKSLGYSKRFPSYQAYGQPQIHCGFWPVKFAYGSIGFLTRHSCSEFIKVWLGKPYRAWQKVVLTSPSRCIHLFSGINSGKSTVLQTELMSKTVTPDQRLNDSRSRLSCQKVKNHTKIINFWGTLTFYENDFFLRIFLTLQFRYQRSSVHSLSSFLHCSIDSVHPQKCVKTQNYNNLIFMIFQYCGRPCPGVRLIQDNRSGRFKWINSRRIHR